MTKLTKLSALAVILAFTSMQQANAAPQGHDYCTQCVRDFSSTMGKCNAKKDPKKEEECRSTAAVTLESCLDKRQCNK